MLLFYTLFLFLKEYTGAGFQVKSKYVYLIIIKISIVSQQQILGNKATAANTIAKLGQQIHLKNRRDGLVVRSSSTAQNGFFRSSLFFQASRVPM